jgi:gentisate 1,2-dioxygenase
LEQLCASRKPNPWHGYKLEYRNPMDGGSVMPTISAFLHGLPQNFQSQRYQTTEHQIFSVVEGTGRTVVGEGENQTEIEWGPRDHFVIPGWYPYAHETEGEAVLFSFSDQVSQKKLGLWREQRHD